MSMLITVLCWVVFGALVGFLAKVIYPGKDPKGFLPTIVIGIAGSFLGGFILWLFNTSEPYSAGGFLSSLVGALVLLFVYHKFFNKDKVNTEK